MVEVRRGQKLKEDNIPNDLREAKEEILRE
jgi:hypothetical protein